MGGCIAMFVEEKGRKFFFCAKRGGWSVRFVGWVIESPPKPPLYYGTQITPCMSNKGGGTLVFGCKMNLLSGRCQAGGKKLRR